MAYAENELHEAIDRLFQRGYKVKNMLRKKLVALVEEEWRGIGDLAS
jgi:hypothetical protein